MRKRTDKEKEVLGKVEAIFKNLDLDKENQGYVPLLDATVYAYAYPKQGLIEIIELLSRKNHYLGLLQLEGSQELRTTSERVYLAIVHTVKSGIERAEREYLEMLQLDSLEVILSGKRGVELEELLLHEIGEDYAEYSNDEKIVLFFIKKILKAVKNEA